MRKIDMEMEFLREGKPSQLGVLRFELESPGHLKVIGWSQYVNFSNITRRIALQELEEVKTAFYEMIEELPELKEFSSDKKLDFNLWYDDSGKASVRICSEKDGNVSWASESIRLR